MSIDAEHGLRVEIARLTKERDELKLQVESKHNALIALREQCDEAREACAAEKARADAAEEAVFQNRKDREHYLATEEALAAARRECLPELQSRVAAWVRTTFTDGALTDRWERAARVVEEAIELGQAEGLSDDDVCRLLRRIYARPVGDVEQEAGGTMVCLLAWAAGRESSLVGCALREIGRIEKPETVEKIRRKQSEKAASGTGRDYSPALAAPAPASMADKLDEIEADAYVRDMGDRE